MQYLGHGGTHVKIKKNAFKFIISQSLRVHFNQKYKLERFSNKDCITYFRVFMLKNMLVNFMFNSGFIYQKPRCVSSPFLP